MEHRTIRKVKILKGRAKEEADKQGLKPEDIVIVTTDFSSGPPKYTLEKIDGDPVSYLLKRAQVQDNPKEGQKT